MHDASLQDQPELYEVLDAARIALERGLSLRSLAASERRAGALLEAMPDSMYRVAADGTFLEFRLGETARLPIDSDSLVGMNVREILSAEASDAVLDRDGACAGERHRRGRQLHAAVGRRPAATSRGAHRQERRRRVGRDRPRHHRAEAPGASARGARRGTRGAQPGCGRRREGRPPGSRLRRRDRGSRAAARRRRREPRPLRRRGRGRGRDRWQVERAGHPDRRGRHGDPGRPRSPRARPADRAPGEGRSGRPRHVPAPRRTARAARGHLAGRRTDHSVRNAVGRGRRLGHRRQDVRGRRRGADRRVREPRRRRTRQRRGARAGRRPRGGTRGAQPRRGRGRDGDATRGRSSRPSRKRSVVCSGRTPRTSCASTG